MFQASPARKSQRVSGLFLAVLVAATLSSPAADISERQLKAEMIVRMLRLVSWVTPGPAAAPLALTVVGEVSLADSLRDAAAGQRIDGRALVIAHVNTLSQLPAPTPEVVVLAAAQRAAAPALARSLAQKSVLTIGDGEGMGRAGMVIGVYIDGDRVRFDANTGAASRAGIVLSSHLLRLARIVG